MQLGVIGLGRMGGNIVRRLTAEGHDCVIFDRQRDAVNALAKDVRAAGAATLDDVVARLKPPRIIWLMLPAGKITDETVATLGAC